MVATECVLAGHGWSRPGVPRRGWACIEVKDLDSLDGECEMCGTEIRYVHVMKHPDYPGPMEAGCVCAGHMEDDYAAPRERERRLKNRAARRERWVQRRWLRSRTGNLRLKVDGRFVGVFRDRQHPDMWKARVDDLFGRKRYPTPEAAMLAVFDFLYPASAAIRP